MIINHGHHEHVSLQYLLEKHEGNKASNCKEQYHTMRLDLHGA